jgi:hypothetical protein
MSEGDAAKSEALVRLAASRAELRRIFEPEPESGPGAVGGGESGTFGTFPRSRTMRLLLSGRGVGTVGAVVGGLVMARPALAFRLLRMIPLSAVARILVVKAIAGLRSKRG